MFLSLLKLQKEAKELDSKGLIKQANAADTRIQKISKFLSTMHLLDLPDRVLKRFTLARKEYDYYMKKHGQYDDWDSDNPEIDTQDSALGLFDRYQDDEEDAEDLFAEDPFDEPVRKKPQTVKKPTGHASLINPKETYIARQMGGNTADKRYFLDLTSAPITMDEEGHLDFMAEEDNPEGFILYLIANPEEQQRPEFVQYRKQIKGEFRNISQEQAQDIIDFFYANPANRETFPGMCLDLYAQLLLRAGGEDVEDKVINSMDPETARKELFGRDVNSKEPLPEEEVNGFTSGGGRMTAFWQYIGRTMKQEPAQAQERVINFWKTKKKVQVVRDTIESRDYSNLFGYMRSSANESNRKGTERSNKQKAEYPNVPDLEKRLLGGDYYALALLKKMQDISGEFGFTIDRDTIDISPKVREALYKRWDFSTLEDSPFASLGGNRSVANKFSNPETQVDLIREVIAEEAAKKGGKDRIAFFVDNPEDVVIREITSLGMLLRFEEFAMKDKSTANLIRAKAALMRKLKQKREYIAAYVAGEAPEGKVPSTKAEEKELLKYSDNYYGVKINPKDGSLSLQPDAIAKIQANRQKRKDVIRRVGERLGEKGGREAMNREAVDNAIRISLQYLRPTQTVSLNAPIGSEGEGGEMGDMQADQNALTPEEIVMRKEEQERALAEGDDSVKINPAMGRQMIAEAKAMAIFVYLSKSNRTAPVQLGFKSAYESGVMADFEKYFSIVKDMVVRKGALEGDTTLTQDVVDIKDTEFMDRLSDEHGKKVITYDVNKDGTTTVTFEDARNITVVNDHPRTKEELIAAQKEEEAEISGKEKKKLLIRAARWMRDFDARKVEEVEDMIQFNTEDPPGAVKPEVEGRSVVREIILDEEFHSKFIDYIRQRDAQDKNWSYAEDIAAKPHNPSSNRGGIKLSEKSFRLGRTLAYLYFVCGIETTQMDPLVMDSNLRPALNSYIGIIEKYYDQFKSEKSIATQEDIDQYMYVPKSVDRDGNERREYARGAQAQEVLMSLSNAEGSSDIDNVIYLASQSFSISSKLPAMFSAPPQHDEEGRPMRGSGLGLSEQRGKAFYLMWIKYILDGLRVGKMGAPELSGNLKYISRLGDIVYSSSSSFGDSSRKISIARGKLESVWSEFEDFIRRLPAVGEAKEDDETGEVSQYSEEDINLMIETEARRTLELLEGRGEIGGKKKDKSGTEDVDYAEGLNGYFDRVYEATEEQYIELRGFERDLEHFLDNYKVGGEPIPNLSIESATDIYKKYEEYLRYRYGEGSSESNPRFVGELVENYDTLNSEDHPDAQMEVSQEIKFMREGFKGRLHEIEQKLEEYIELGINAIDSLGVEEMESEIPSTLEEDMDGETIEEVQPEIVQPEPTVVQPEPTVVEQQPFEQFPTVPEGYEEKMQHLLGIQKSYWGKSVPAGSQEQIYLENLGFSLEQDPNNTSSLYVGGNPPELLQYIKELRKRTLEDRRKSRQTNAKSEIDKYIVIGEKEIGYLLYRYGV